MTKFFYIIAYLTGLFSAPITFSKLHNITLPFVKVELEYHGGTTYKIEVNTAKYKVGNISQLYDGIKELNIVEGKSKTCYFITCTAPYPVKWVTNIPLKNLDDGEQILCGGDQTWKYFNSVRPGVDPLGVDMDENTTEINSTTYTIQFIFHLVRIAGGLLKCLSIENSTYSTDIYFTNTATDEINTEFKEDLVKYDYELSDTEFRTLELFWERKPILGHNDMLTIPCKAKTLETTQSLVLLNRLIRGLYSQQENLTAKAALGIEYSPVVGFIVKKPDFEDTKNIPTNKVNVNTGKFVGCTDDGVTFVSIRLLVYPTGAQTSTLKILEDSTQFRDQDQNGCFLLRKQDKFIFRRKHSDFITDEIAQNWHPLKFMQCNTPHECDILRQCLDFQGKSCYSDRGQMQVGTFSTLWEGVSIEAPYNRGLIRCMDYRGKIGFKPLYEYTFIGLDKRRYVLSEDIPKSAIIFVAETAITLYTNVKSTFQCQISSFILVPNIRFGLLYSNGTVVLNDNQQIVEMYDTNDISSVMDSNFNLGIGEQEISLNLTADVVGIMCFAPFHNSSQWVNVSRKFVAKDVRKPEIDKSGGSIPKTFQRDDSDFSLHCSAKGVPEPNITWHLPHDNMKIGVSTSNDSTIYLTEIKNEDGDSFLQFPPMQQTFEGIFKCLAQNEYGDDTQEFPIKFEESGLQWEGIAGIIVGAIALVAFAAGFFVLLRKYRYAKRQLRDLTEEEIDEFKNGSGIRMDTIGGSGIDLNMLPFKKEYILPPGVLMIEKNAVLGEGQYGIVHRGLLNGVAVAVKTTKSVADVAYVKAFLGELKVMAYLGSHPNIIEFLGADISQIRERIVKAVVELCPKGNLQQHLRKLRSNQESFVNLVKDDVLTPPSSELETCDGVLANKVTTIDLVNYCKQIASGMAYLASKRVYHGDLAARNVLLFNDNVVKITDFGLSKQLYSSASYIKKQKVALPWRWMALETIRFMEFSIESDVWAFAVTAWEIFSLGVTPYPGLTWTNEFVNIISNGMRMAKPQYCPKDIFDLMLKCWNEKKEERPNFANLTEFFDNILKSFGVSQSCDESSTTGVEPPSDETPIVYADL